MQTKDTIIKILNCFETGSQETNYSSIFVYADGPQDKHQLTLARGFTECGGTLWKVFQRYADKGGVNGARLLEYKKDSCQQTLPTNQSFRNLIHESCADSIMIEAQDEIYDEIYYKNGEVWAAQHGFKLPLSLLVIQDSMLQSGSILQFLRDRFSAKVPSDSGDEKTWITDYVIARDNWLLNHSRVILRGTVYRTHFLKKQIDLNNWDLKSFPIYPNGVKIEA